MVIASRLAPIRTCWNDEFAAMIDRDSSRLCDLSGFSSHGEQAIFRVRCYRGDSAAYAGRVEELA